MKSLLLLLVLIASVGCRVVERQESGSMTQSSQMTAVPAVQRDNPNRLHQLRTLKKVTLNVKGKKVEAWVMDSQSKITEGMMWLTNRDVKANQGMLFVFEKAEPRSFWMANCPLGLDIAFMTPKGKILNIQSGKPFSESPLPSKGPAQYVLEVKAGTLNKWGVKPGDTISIPKGLSYKG